MAVAFHTLTVADVEPLTDDAVAVTFDVPDDLVHRLADAGYAARVEIALSPAWSSDWITERGRQALRDHGLSAPGPAPRSGGPIPLTLMPTARAVSCPQCDSARTELTSEYGATACKALYRCSDCLEPFEHVKEI